ncbi:MULTISPECIES: fumarylacetoacetate hydrolase family protein [Burkholderia]|uniref:FAA hydrolase family protein n=1 Tax=Burkholderia gladioli TaxID=28095 RepID=A0A2A7SCM4_BURGA|nr:MULTISPECIES: fumarylacetoacetate hydrolase family protein [Burkholderia]ATF89383.1 2-hydroxyhepta-2,4-diene-1,7-dioate isomerase [Burkholderia gladioli pv. gladioli]MBJ9714391.1 fumarylacetoacetate hydrolase family protein [Burkholderia gladioli]MBU9153482.1 fumarylacetoacetate hydrolase family protein [Burkholderia gladioli]MBU9169928.1 fumarylacetoacetate hydrolase family protein [Burkholderia gladioli]MBU9196263.1 fumarylacetoacetate hydrolase family protein [Burkholderia gladioli]
MKLLRYGPRGQEKPGLLDRDGRLRDLSAICEDYTPAFFAGGGIERLRGVDPQTLPLVAGEPRIGACIAQPGNFIAIGLNYVQHAIETDAPIPAEPILFNKAPSCLSGPYDPVILPKGSRKCDWEVEIAMVIGKPALYVDEADALDHVAGYCVCNDVSEREMQLEHGGQWVKGKMFPSFGPLGPWLVTTDEAGDAQDLGLWLELNGRRVQDSSTSDMIFTLARIVSYASRHVLLQPGDVITTGTPPGVGLGMKPEQYLKPGDVMELGVAGLGVQKQTVLAWEDSPFARTKAGGHGA